MVAQLYGLVPHASLLLQREPMAANWVLAPALHAARASPRTKATQAIVRWRST